MITNTLLFFLRVLEFSVLIHGEHASSYVAQGAERMFKSERNPFKSRSASTTDYFCP